MAMRAADRTIEILFDALERQGQGGPASDQHIIMSGANATGCMQSDDLTQAPAHAIAFHRIPDFLGDGEAEPRRTLIVPALGL